jgi:hypothetical protein
MLDVETAETDILWQSLLANGCHPEIVHISVKLLHNIASPTS